MTEITFSGQLTEEELARILQRGMNSRRTLVTDAIVFLVVTAVTVFVVFQSGEIPPVGLVIMLIALFFLFMFQYLKPSLMAGRLFKQKVDITGPLSGVITDEAVTIQTTGTKAVMQWSFFQSAKIAGDLVLLYQNNNSFNFFPRPFFADESDWSEFQRLVGEKVNRKSGIAPSKLPFIAPRRVPCLIYMIFLAAILGMLVYSFMMQSR